MKKIVTGILLFIICSSPVFVRAQQGPVNDRYPEAAIYVVDPQTGQETPDGSDGAILFKDAFIDLVTNTNQARYAPKTFGHKTLTITQADPANGISFQLTLQSKVFGQMITNYTFSYNVDQNTLYYLDPNVQSWNPVLVQGNNVVNLNACLSYGKFTQQYNTPPVPQAVDNSTQNNTDVTAEAAPPVLQDEAQPDCPVDGYLWQPGYWAYNPYHGYYWVQGTWIAPPTVGYLWTPPYWGYEGNVYVFHRGYWGTTVGFYGGVYYGYGYGGSGYVGGVWAGDHFRYNTAVVRVGPSVHNVYIDRTVVTTHVIVNNRVSYNGGAGGMQAKPTQQERGSMTQNHVYDNHQDPKAPVANSNNQFKNNGNTNRTDNTNLNRSGTPGNTNNNNRQVNAPASTTNSNINRPANTQNVNRPSVPQVPAGNRPSVPSGAVNNRQGVPQGPGSRTNSKSNTNNKPAQQPKQNDKRDQK